MTMTPAEARRTLGDVRAIAAALNAAVSREHYRLELAAEALPATPDLVSAEESVRSASYLLSDAAMLIDRALRPHDYEVCDAATCPDCRAEGLG